YGEISNAVRASESLAALAERRDPFIQLGVLTPRCTLALAFGRFDEAEGIVSEHLAVARKTQNDLADQSFLMQGHGLRRERGSLADFLHHVRNMADRHATVPLGRCVLASTYVDLGAEGEA